jgi:hypothetical protein
MSGRRRRRRGEEGDEWMRWSEEITNNLKTI